MKTKIELNGFEITIEDIEGKVEVKVEFGDETIEEMTFDQSEYVDADESEELKAFGDEDEAEGEEVENETEEETEDEDEDEQLGESQSLKSFSDMFPPKKK